MKREFAAITFMIFAFALYLPSFASAETLSATTAMGAIFRINDHTPYVSGYGNEKFGPNNNITRAEAAQMLYNLLNDPISSQTSYFSDVPIDRWYGQAVNALAQIGIFHGYGDKTFRPNNPITRAELVTALTACVPQSSADNIFSDVSSNHWAYRSIITAAANKWISGYPDKTFRPNQTITRAETVAIINRALGRTGDGFAQYRTGQFFSDISENSWAYLHIVEASGATSYQGDQVEKPRPEALQLQVTASSLNLRSGPGTNYNVLLTLGNGALLTLIDKQHSPWLHVKAQGNVEGYVHGDYVAEYVPNTASAEKITLSSNSVVLSQYKTFRLDGNSIPGTSLVWSSSNENIATVSSIRYGEGDESCFIYAKAPGEAVISCSDYKGTVKANCSVTVQGPEVVRFAFTEPNLITTGESVDLFAITDAEKNAVRFSVENRAGVTILTQDVSVYTVERYSINTTNVFSFRIGPLNEDTYFVKVFSADSSGSFEGPYNFSFTVHSSNAKEVSTFEHRDISDEMVALIMDYEKYVPVLYDDPVSPKNPTVGYGYVVNTNTSFYNNMTRREAAALLIEEINSDYGKAVNDFREKNALKMSQSHYDALVSFCYNLGTSYIKNPSGNFLFTTILNGVIPPDNISPSNPCAASLNVTDANLYDSPNRSANVIQKLYKGAGLQVVGINRDNESKEIWYAVKVGSSTGWMRGGNIRLNMPSIVHDLNYVDSMTFATYILAYHHTSVCEPGLLYRRLREAKLFTHADYQQASSDNAYSTKNTYHYIYPDCVKSYEGF